MSQATFLHSTKGQQSHADSHYVPSFIDLQAFAEEPFEVNDSASESDQHTFLTQRRTLPLPVGPVEMGIIQLQAGTGVVTELAADEFIFVLKGTLFLTQAGRRHDNLR